MNKYQLLLALASGVKNSWLQEVAVVVEQKNVTCIGFGDAEGVNTAVAVALQNTSELQKCDIYTTYEPTDLCLGMAQICQVNSICYLDNHRQQLCRRPTFNVAPNESKLEILRGKPLTDAEITIKAGGNAEEQNVVDIKIAKEKPDDIVATRKVFAKWWDGVFLHAKAWYDEAGANFVTTFESAARHFKVICPTLVDVPLSVGKTFPSSQLQRDDIFMLTAYSIAAITWTRSKAWEGNKVACVLVDPSDRIVSWGINMGRGQNATWHAEIAALRHYSKHHPDIERGLRLYTTLKPCHMCSGMIAEAAKGGRITVIYGQDDPNIIDNCGDRFFQYQSFVSSSNRMLGWPEVTGSPVCSQRC